MSKFVLILGTIFLAACAGLTKDPDDQVAAQLNAELGIEYLQRGNIERAKSKLDLAAQQGPNDALVAHANGLLQGALNEYDAALSWHRRAVKAAPNNSQYNNALGVALCRAEQYDEAQDVFAQVVADKLYRTPEFALDNAALCKLHEGDWSRAIAFSRSALKRNEQFAPAQLHLAEALARAGEAKEALLWINRYHRNPAQATPGSLLLAARIAHLNADVEATQVYSRTLLNRFPDSEEAQLLLQNS